LTDDLADVARSDRNNPRREAGHRMSRHDTNPANNLQEPSQIPVIRRGPV